jgi:hypothetical protein
MRRLLLVLGLPLIVSACASPNVRAMHDPIYRAEDHTSTITARASQTRDGVAEITIEAIVGDLTACESMSFLLPSLIPCRANAIAMGAVCTFANVTTEVGCSLPIPLRGPRLVTYTARARSGANRTGSTGAVTYAGGPPLTQARWNLPPIGTITMPWETARPILWRTDSPSMATNRSDKIDLGLLPDADMPNYRAFTDDLQPIVLQLFYTDTNQFTVWTRTWKNLFNVWAGPVGADGEGCTRNFSGAAATVRQAFDGTAILHRNAFRDCASISLGGGAGTTETPLSDATWALLHEAGHYLFGLGDEYVGGGNASVSQPKNVYSSKATCESNSTANGLPATQCVQIGMTGTWRNDDGQLTTMEDRNLASDWRTLSGKAMSNMVTKCTSGSCY